MDMTGIIGWVLFVMAAVVATVLFVGQAAPRKALAEAEAKLRDAEAALEAAQKQPVAATVNGEAIPLPASPGVQKKLAANAAEVKRLEAALADADKKVRAAQEKAAHADTRIAAADAKAASAEAMVAQVRSKAVEAGHLALQEAKRETEAVRAALADAEKRVAEVSLGETKISELARTAERAESLQAQLAESEARTKAAVQSAERTLHEQFEAQLQTVKQAFEAEKQHLAAELETARTSTVPQPISTEPEGTMPVRPRKQPSPTKSAEIGTEEKPLVIVADTDAKNTDTIAKHLDTAGYAVRAVQTVAEAMAVARTMSPAALAIDGANLPDGDCWQVLTAMKEDAGLKEIPVLVFAPGKDKEKAMEMGAAGCFAKPVDKAVMVATIKAAMVKRKQRARLAAVSGGATGTPRRSALLTTEAS